MTHTHACTHAQTQLGGTATDTSIMARRPSRAEYTRIMSYLLWSDNVSKVCRICHPVHNSICVQNHQNILSICFIQAKCFGLYKMISKIHNMLQKMPCVVKRNHIMQSYSIISANIIQFTQKHTRGKGEAQQPTNPEGNSSQQPNSKNREQNSRAAYKDYFCY